MIYAKRSREWTYLVIDLEEVGIIVYMTFFGKRKLLKVLW